MLREVLRSVEEVADREPAIKISSFLVGKELTRLTGVPHSVQDGIEAQCKAVWPILRGSIARIREKNGVAIFEGVSVLNCLLYGDKEGIVPRAGSRVLSVT